MGDSAWTKSKVRNEYYLHNYLPDMPELNLNNPKVREELKVTVHILIATKVEYYRKIF